MMLEVAELDAFETSLGYHSAYFFPTGCYASPSPFKTPKTDNCEKDNLMRDRQWRYSYHKLIGVGTCVAGH